MNAVPPASELMPHKLTVDELLSMVDSGAFNGLPPMELLNGVLYEMSPQHSPHVYIKNELGYRLRRGLEAMNSPLCMLIEPTIRIGETTAVEPDIGVFTQSRVNGFYPVALVRLAVEVSTTTKRTDLGFKRALYAEAGVPEYWVVDVDARLIHQFAETARSSYAEPKLVPLGDDVTSVIIADLTVSTADLI